MWQLANPESKGDERDPRYDMKKDFKPLFLVCHKLKFMTMNLDACTGKTAREVVNTIGGFQPFTYWGSPLYVRDTFVGRQPGRGGAPDNNTALELN